MTKPINPAHHWQPASKCEFLETLAATGSVEQAATAAGKSRTAAYTLKLCTHEEAFRLGWSAAQIVAREAVLDTLTERFVDGIQMTTTRDKSDPERIVTTRRSYQNRVGLALLTRLDKLVETQPAPDTIGGEAAIVARAFPDWLDLVSADGSLAETRAALARLKQGIQCQLPDQPSETTPEISEEEAANLQAAGMETWFHPDHGEWRCNFPPPEDFDGNEEGAFGCTPTYSRQLTEDEEEHWDKLAKAVMAPLRTAGEAARRLYFEIPQRKKARKPKRAKARNLGTVLGTKAAVSTLERETVPKFSTSPEVSGTEEFGDSFSRDSGDPITGAQNCPQIHDAVSGTVSPSLSETPAEVPKTVPETSPEEFVNGIRVFIPGTKLFTEEYQRANNFKQHIPRPRPYRQIPWYAERIK